MYHMNKIFTSKFLIVGLCFFLTSMGFAQELRFGFNIGAAIPVGGFALTEATPDSGGFAQPGFDLQLSGDRVAENGLILGINLGYSFYGMDHQAIKESIAPNNPELVNVETQSFQNLTLLARIGYNWDVVEERLAIVPYLNAGLGVFNSAYYGIQDLNGNFAYRAGNASAGFLLSPGLEALIQVNPNVAVKAYGTYQFATYNVDETFTFNGNQSFILKNRIQYDFSSVNAGIGVVFNLGI